MRRRLLLLALLAACLAGCGGSHESSPPATLTSGPTLEATAVLGPGARTLFQGSSWGVVVSGSRAVAVRLVGGVWQADRRGAVKVTILGPHGTTGKITQVAAGLKAKTALVESGLWVDGRELIEKGGGSPTNGTIYGATPQLKPGQHVAVAYARTQSTGTAVAWTFTSR